MAVGQVSFHNDKRVSLPEQPFMSITLTPMCTGQAE